MAKSGTITADHIQRALVYLLGLLIPASVFASWYYDILLLVGLPAFFLLVYLCIVDFKKVFYLLLLCLPLSMEVSLPGGFATDLPTEPLMVGLMLIYLVYLARHAKNMDASFLKNPLSVLVLLHFFWLVNCTIHSGNVFVSFKFTLAKFWYIVVFYFLAGSLLKKEKDIRSYLWCVFYPLVFTVIVILIRHAAKGFAFDQINNVMFPFYRNHVNYASLLGLFVPFVWYLRKAYPTWSAKWWGLVFGLLVLIAGIQFAYTRAVYLALIVAIGTHYIIRFRLMKLALSISLVGLVAMILFFATNNAYLEYAPEYEKTVAHTEFDNLVAATTKGQDVSLMERFYRWIAGGYMIQERPWFGFGPGNFYNYYQSYTVSSFETYVSDNPEKSGAHSYYLMTAVEQGIPGMLIFLMINIYFLLFGEKVYHQCRSKSLQYMVMALLLSVVVINTLLLINDLIETDKIGSFFFISLALLVNIHQINQKELASTDP
ncbi:MAG: O-antigen ligase family protein [Bacteroidota bacterium]